jgi:hypothetical protein
MDKEAFNKASVIVMDYYRDKTNGYSRGRIEGIESCLNKISKKEKRNRKLPVRNDCSCSFRKGIRELCRYLLSMPHWGHRPLLS